MIQLVLLVYTASTVLSEHWLWGLFSDGAGTEWKGLLTGGGFHGFGVQFIGMAITIAWVAVTMTIIFQVIKHTIGLRVSAEEEIAGLDMKEHGLASAYDGFFVQDTMTKSSGSDGNFRERSGYQTRTFCSC